MNMKLKAAAAAVALAVSGSAQAAFETTDVFAVIGLTGADGPLESMLVNTDLNAADLASGAVNFYESDAELTSAISTFIGDPDAEQVRFWVAGASSTGLSTTFLSFADIADENTATSQARNKVINYVETANLNYASQLDAEGYVTGIAPTDGISFFGNILGGSGLVGSAGLDSETAFLANTFDLFGTGTGTTTVGSWTLASDGTLTYVPLPAAAWLLGAGLLGLLGFRRRRSA